MQAHHAPGPWTVNGKTIKSVDHGHHYTVARVDNPKFTPEANAAHARLIAAAPDLLDALRRVLRHIPADAGGASMSDDVYRARAAIARATREN